MKCQHFGLCGGCELDLAYEKQLESKLQQTQQEFSSLFSSNGFSSANLSVHNSVEWGFRARAEFRFYTDENRIYFAMSNREKNHRTPITQCPILLPIIQKAMPLVIESLEADEVLRTKIYACNFLANIESQEIIISLIYHKRLDSIWEQKAQNMRDRLHKALSATIHIIGRAKNQKILLSTPCVRESLRLFADSKQEQIYTYFKQESSFSQPNPFINTKMLEFVITHLKTLYPQPNNDMLELYCGGGNFSIALSGIFRQILATEVVKSAISLLQQNMEQNFCENITPVRLNALETQVALSGEREFFRLRGIDIKSFNFDCVLIDPPRSGVNELKILHFLQQFSTIVYVSCNPSTLLQDLQTLTQSHSILHFGLFDQFPHTHHRECVVILRQK